MSVTTNLVQTNAGWMLRTAWRKVTGHDVPAARAALDVARRLDPTDARVPAYQGALLAQPSFRRLDRARLEMAGTHASALFGRWDPLPSMAA